MKPEEDIKKEVREIDEHIDRVQGRIRDTEKEISTLIKRNERRKEYSRSLGKHRSELMTWELNLSLPADPAPVSAENNPASPAA